ncbi:ectomycorrhiza-regulated small secreted protein [Mycena crocata]|nr:ectomycorrhiza-regulated small secreted protein [Mycena crocata]
MSGPLLHPLLQYSQHDKELGDCNLILWDLREPPRTADHAAAPDRPLSEFELSQHATIPPVSRLRVTCGIFAEEAWISQAQNWLGVTIRNVLDAIYETVRTQINYEEWDRLCPKQQQRVNIVFDARWRRSTQPMETRDHGILRGDCLLQHVVFAGLSTAPDSEDTYLLTLRRLKR